MCPGRFGIIEHQLSGGSVLRKSTADCTRGALFAQKCDTHASGASCAYVCPFYFFPVQECRRWCTYDWKALRGRIISGSFETEKKRSPNQKDQNICLGKSFRLTFALHGPHCVPASAGWFKLCQFFRISVVNCWMYNWSLCGMWVHSVLRFYMLMGKKWIWPF